MVVRVVMTTLLMVENLTRMVLQTVFNFVSFMLQLVSLVPLCCVFLVSSRLKCFMCGGGGLCPLRRGGACDCLMSLAAIVILFFIFRATGVLDKIFYSIGYAKATTQIVRFAARTGTGSVTECSRNDTDTEYAFYPIDTTETRLLDFYVDDLEVTTEVKTETITEEIDTSVESTANYTDKPVNQQGLRSRFSSPEDNVLVLAVTDENKEKIIDLNISDVNNEVDWASVEYFDYK
ncbi:hypothetical protein NE865_12229 [Phthorimaea operculella]|nr:hypothetical protein NE865_12229 [Phthorimaea operculella]